VNRQRLNRAQIAELLAVARLQRHATESERIEAVKYLLCEYRLQIAEFRRPRPLWFWQVEPFRVFDERVIDPLLEQGIEQWGRWVFAQAKPVLALARFLGERKKPGKRAKYTERNFAIALAVINKMEGGMTLEEAAQALSISEGTAKRHW
jgi:hypothetical protein